MDPSTPEPHRQEPDESDGGPVRPTEIVAGDFLLTLNPVDGSGIERWPPERQPTVSRKAAGATGTTGKPTSGSIRPLVARDEERQRLVRRLAGGRSIRVTGPAGTGRTALLTAVAKECADLAPDGVIHLSGHRRSLADLQQELYASARHAVGYRPGATQLRSALREIGAVVVIDDLECDGVTLSRLLDATPECAFLVATAPGSGSALASDSRIEELALSGLSRSACLELLENVAQRPLSDVEADWAADLWGANEGLPVRFVQAGALLRQRDAGRATGLLPEPGAVVGALAAALPDGTLETLRLVAALGGLVPAEHQLPALAGDPRAASTREELADFGLITSSGAQWRLATGVGEELARAGQTDPAVDRSRTAVQHYTWWLSEANPTLAQVAEEAEVVLAVAHAAQRRGHEASVASLGRSAAPQLAAALCWGAWERMLRAGQECARTAGFVDAQAYFHHELGVLAIYQDRLDRARAELEASVGLRGVLADSGGVHAGRRALALVHDMAVATPPAGAAPAPATRPAAARVAAAAAAAAASGPTDGSEADTEMIATVPATAVGGSGVTARRSDKRWPIIAGTRRNAAAAGAGALVAAVLGTVVTLGLISGEGDSDDRQPNNDPVTAPDGDTEGPEDGSASPSPDEADDADSGGTPSGSDDPEEGQETDSSEPTHEETPEPPATSPPDDGGTSSPTEPPTSTPPPSDPEPSDPDPTDPTDPTDPGPTDPDPTDPTDPTDPDPTDPTDPDPTDPTDPDPTDPDPTDPDPTDSPTSSSTPEPETRVGA